VNITRENIKAVFVIPGNYKELFCITQGTAISVPKG